MKAAYICISGLVIFSSLAEAELKFKSSATASYVNNESNSSAYDKRKSDILTLEPSIGATYSAKKLQGSANIKYLYVDNNASGGLSDVDVDQNKNFTNFDYNARFNAIENVLFFSARGAQSYRNTIAGNALVNDELFGSQELSKTKHNSASFRLSLTQGDWVRAGFDGTYSNVKSDRQVYVNSNLDSTNASLSARIYSGDEVKRVNWSLTGQYHDTNGTGFNDSISQTYQGDFRVGLLDEINLVLTGQSEKNEIRSDQAEATRNYDYNSYGLGLSWYRSAERFVDITYNQSTRDNEESKGFLGAKLNWRFTARTSLKGEYGRRFYGRSGNLSLSHQTRKLRTKVTYEENVTNYTRLIAGDLNFGVFVCPIGVTDITLCFQPPSIDYQLQPGEEFSALAFFTPEISEAVILRKNLVANVGYSFRKIKTNLTVRSTNTKYLDGTREQDILNVSLNNSLRLNRKTTVSAAVTYISFENALSDDRLSADNEDVLSVNLKYNRTLSKDLTATIGLQHTERRSPVLNRDYDSDRISLRLRYTLF